MQFLKSSGFFRAFFVGLILFNITLPLSCQTFFTGENPPGTLRAQTGEFKAAVLGNLRPGDPFVVAAAGTGIPGSAADEGKGQNQYQKYS